MKHHQQILKSMVLLWMIMVLCYCKPGEEPSEQPPVVEEDTTTWVIEHAQPGAPISHIMWGEPVKVSHEVFGAEYPRMLQLSLIHI